jgi:Ser/Thr protein kinase RdoA (MazF antagonist)
MNINGMLLNETILQKILLQFGLESVAIQPFGSGLINRTWKVNTLQGNFILQKINEKVFKHPEDIAYNIRKIAAYLQTTHPDYLFVRPVVAQNGEDIVFDKKYGSFRLMPFVENSYTYNVVETPQQAYEAAKQFGRFTKMLAHFPVEELKITIPDFHNLSLRYQQFLQAVSGGNEKRKEEAKNLIQQLLNYHNIVQQYEQIIHHSHFKLRVTHHDTKISNVLFDKDNNGICVIDLDTVMPGYFISDVGDMMRTYLSPVSEEEQEFEKIMVRKNIYHAIIEGYSSEMKNELTGTEKQYFLFAGKFMIYMQALRFLTDYLNNDVYYGAKYEKHNFIRATNQTILLQCLQELE